MCKVCEAKGDAKALEGQEELNCGGCPEVVVIPNITGLRRLYCNFCPLLRDITSMGLEVLQCCNCPKLTTLPPISTLKTLLCYDAGLLSIPVIPGLQTLECGGESLTSISKLVGLKKLKCIQTSSLTHLPKINGLTYLQCFACPLLKEIPHMADLQKLSLAYVSYLVSVPAGANCKVDVFRCPLAYIPKKVKSVVRGKSRAAGRQVRDWAQRARVRVASRAELRRVLAAMGHAAFVAGVLDIAVAYG